MDIKKMVKNSQPLFELIDKAVKEDFNSYAMWMVRDVSLRSKCLSRQVGCVIVQGKHIISTGYNGPTMGFPHPQFCRRCELGVASGMRLELCPCAHDAGNAVAQAAKNGTATNGAALYTFPMPCTLSCASMIVGAGIKRVIVLSKNEYHSDPEAIPASEKFRYAGISLEEYQGPLRGLLLELNSGMREESAKMDACAEEK